MEIKRGIEAVVILNVFISFDAIHMQYYNDILDKINVPQGVSLFGNSYYKRRCPKNQFGIY